MSDFNQILQEIQYATTIDQKIELFDSLLPLFSKDTIEISLLDVLMDCASKGLKTQNSKLNISVLYVIQECCHRFKTHTPSLVHPLKSLIFAFFASIVDRLGDGKSRVAEVATGVIQNLYSEVLLLSTLEKSNTIVSILAHMDKEIKTNGLGHKVAKGRENSLVWIHYILDKETFQLKQYLPLIIKLLEDSNELVRAGAKEVMMKIYREHPSKTVKSDIKKEMTHQGIRGSIIESILNCGKDDAKMPEDETSSDKAGNSNIVSIQFSSGKELEMALNEKLQWFEGKETEANWMERENAMIYLRCVFKGTPFSVLKTALKDIIEAIAKAAISLRTTLAVAACTLINDVCHILKTDFDSYCEPVFNVLMKMVAQTKKMTVTVATESLMHLIHNTTFNPRLFTVLCHLMADKNTNARIQYCHFIEIMLQKLIQEEDVQSSLDKFDLFEKTLENALGDANAQVREKARLVLALYQEHWNEKSIVFLNNIDPLVKKTLSKSGVVAKRKVAIGTPSSLRSLIKKAKENRTQMEVSEVDFGAFAVQSTDVVSGNIAQKADFSRVLDSPKSEFMLDETIETKADFNIGEEDVVREEAIQEEQEMTEMTKITEHKEEITEHKEKDMVDAMVEDIVEGIIAKEVETVETVYKSTENAAETELSEEEAGSMDSAQENGFAHVLDETMPFGFAEMSTCHYEKDHELSGSEVKEAEMWPRNARWTMENEMDEFEAEMHRLKDLPAEIHEFRSMIEEMLSREDSKDDIAENEDFESELPCYLQSMKEGTADVAVFVRLGQWMAQSEDALVTEAKTQELMAVYFEETMDILAGILTRSVRVTSPEITSQTALANSDAHAIPSDSRSRPPCATQLEYSLLLVKLLISHHPKRLFPYEKTLLLLLIDLVSHGNHSVAAQSHQALLLCARHFQVDPAMRSCLFLLRNANASSAKPQMLPRLKFDAFSNFVGQIQVEKEEFSPCPTSTALDFMAILIRKETCSKAMRRESVTESVKDVSVRKSAFFCLVELARQDVGLVKQAKMATHHQNMIHMYLKWPERKGDIAPTA